MFRRHFLFILFSVFKTTPLYFSFTKRQPNPFLSSNNKTLFWHTDRRCQLLVLICAHSTKNTFWGLVPGPKTVSSLFQLQIWHSYDNWRNEFWTSPCILRDNCTALQMLTHILQHNRRTHLEFYRRCVFPGPFRPISLLISMPFSISLLLVMV